LAEHLRQTVENCEEVCRAAGIAFQAEVIEGDFIRAAVELLADCPLWGTAHSAFDCAILNPPYRKLNSESVVSGYKSNSDNWLRQRVSEFGTKEVESA
jgi:adenine-specific DNA-methyltransferase